MLRRLGGEEGDAPPGRKGELHRREQRGGGLPDPRRRRQEQVTSVFDGGGDGLHRFLLNGPRCIEWKGQGDSRFAPGGPRALARPLGCGDRVDARPQVRLDLAGGPRYVLDAVVVASQIDEQEASGRVAGREEAPRVEAGLPAEPLEPLLGEGVIQLGFEVERLDLFDDVALVVRACQTVGSPDDSKLPAIDGEGRVDGNLAGVPGVVGLALVLNGPVEFGSHGKAGKPLSGHSEAQPDALRQEVVNGAGNLPLVEVETHRHPAYSTRSTPLGVRTLEREAHAVGLESHRRVADSHHPGGEAGGIRRRGGRVRTARERAKLASLSVRLGGGVRWRNFRAYCGRWSSSRS